LKQELAEMFINQDMLYVFTAVAFAAVGSIISSIIIGKARSTPSSVRYAWAMLGGFLLGTTVWIGHFLIVLGLSNVEAEQFVLSHTYGSLVVSIVLCSIATSCSLAMERNLGLVAGISVASAVLFGHVSSITAIDYHLAIKVSEFSLPAATFIAFCISIAAFTLRYSNVKFGPLLASVLLVAAIIVPQEIALSGITWETSASSAILKMAVTSHFLFATLIVIGGIMLALVCAVLIVDRQHLSERFSELERLAYLDALTGLPNRVGLLDKLPAISRAAQNHLTVVAIGISNYRDTVDVHGHEAGDELVKAVSQAVDRREWPFVACARVSEDRFIAVISSRAGQTTGRVVGKLKHVAVTEVDWNGSILAPGIVMGVAVYPSDGAAIEDVVVKADLALSRAWRSGTKTPVSYVASLDEPNRDRSALSIDMRQALKKGQFELAFQRQNSVNDGRIVGYEALLRWKHPKRGSISPDVFIPLAEREGLIEEIGEWVLIEACREAASWSFPRKIAVNVSPRQLANDEFPNVVRRALSLSSLSPSRLEVEITESGIIADKEQALKIVSELREIGVSIAMDDYGTGYSSLSTLKAFPFSKVKIDKAFISGIETDSHAEAIVRSTLSLCRELSVDVVAEGVETSGQRDMLAQMGCLIAQGFLYGQPMAAKTLQAAQSERRRSQ
jgi:diguanylate cyclase (GGDEF)-like protein